MFSKSEEEFKKLVGLSKDVVKEFIQQMKLDYRRKRGRPKKLSIRDEILLFLIWLRHSPPLKLGKYI